MNKFCTLIPVFNHYKNLPEMINSIIARDIPCIIVDDGSNEKTKRVIRDLERDNSRVIKITLENNSGKGTAVIEGFRQAFKRDFTHAIQIDADNQHDINDIPEIIRLSEENPDALILGYPVFGKDVPASRFFGRKISRFWTKIETFSSEIKDPLCGFRCYPLKPVMPVIEKYRVGSRMDFDPHILIMLYWSGVETVGFDTKIRYNVGEGSRFRMFKDNILISFMFFRLFWIWLFKIPYLLRRNIIKKKNSSNSWAQISERGSSAGIKFSYYIYKVFGKKITRLILQPVILYFLLTGKKARQASLNYLRQVSSFCNSSGLPTAPGFIQTMRHYSHFSSNLIDRFGIGSGILKDIQLDWHGKEFFYELMEKKQGALVMSAHFGPIDSLRVILYQEPEIRVRPLMYRKHAQMINSVFKSINTQTESDIIPMESITVSSAVRFREIVENGEFLGLLADRVSAGAQEKTVNADFMGRSAPFPQGPWILANILKCPVLLLFTVNNGNNRYEIHCEKFSDGITLPRRSRENSLKNIISSFSSRLESYCCRYPYEWSNFYDFWDRQYQ